MQRTASLAIPEVQLATYRTTLCGPILAGPRSWRYGGSGIHEKIPLLLSSKRVNGFGLDLGEQGVILDDTSTSIEEGLLGVPPVLPVKKLIIDGGVHLLKMRDVEAG